MSVPEAIRETQRCLKCVDAPCSTACPSQVNVQLLHNSIADGNFYGAAKSLLTQNPLAWSCGLLCPTKHFCRGSCVLNDTLHGPIHIDCLHTVVLEAFMRMKLPQIRDPNIKDEPYFATKIALIGAGPASLSCATFLARIGYKDITIFEKKAYPGGTPAIEIPEFRLPYHVTRFEVKLVEDMGVKFEFNKSLGKDFTIDSLKADGYKSIFIGIGYPEPSVIRQFREAKGVSNVWNSKEFLTTVCEASKPGMVTEQVPALPDLKGSVVVCGAGDVAADCCQAAFRCGADFVSLVFRRGTIDMRMNEDEAEGLKREKVELIGCCSPKELIVKDGKATEVVCELMKKVPGTDRYEKDGDQLRTISFDHVISAFGSQIGPDIFKPCTINEKTWTIEVNDDTLATPVEGVYAGGDCVGNGTIVEAANDGKVAAWGMHRFIAKSIGSVDIPVQPAELPPFMTPVDLVDTSVTIAGLKFPNPFGLASGPSTENCIMLKRAFRAGFGWAVTKTFQPDEDMLDNVSPRIVGCAQDNTYLNIELNSERKVEYWERELPKLKKEFPDNIVLASIHSKGDHASWVTLAKRIAATGVDGLQLNISCPNLGEKDAKPFSEIIQETIEAVRAEVSLPLFPKIGHFQGDIVALAKAAKAGGANGVSGVNTISGLYSVSADGTFTPEVGFGDAGKTSYGGLSGRAIKPFALSAVAEVSKAVPNFPFLACGGAENALTAWEFMQCGASAVQFCSASMHKGFKHLAHELIPGLQFLLYARAHPEMKSWTGIVPPEMLVEGGKRPLFGPYEAANERKEIEDCLTAPLPAKPIIIEEFVTPDVKVDVIPATEAKTVASEAGSALKKVVPFGEMDVAVKVISEIDLTHCFNCGRCQVACFDAGYACIIFDKVTRIPRVSPACHGCGLCVAVCPAKCIKMVPKPPKK